MVGKSALPSPAIAQSTLSPLKLSFALSEVDCCHTSWFGTNIQSKNCCYFIENKILFFLYSSKVIL